MMKMITLADCDDPNVLKLLSVASEKGVDCKAFWFGLDSKRTEVFHCYDNTTVRQGRDVLNENVMAEADFIWFSRWKMFESPFSKCSFADKPTCTFAESEWESFWQSFLIWIESKGVGRWINSPRIASKLRYKQFLLLCSQDHGLKVPDYCISTKLHRVGDCCVGKAVSSNEFISPELKYSTQIIPDVIFESSIEHTGCPNFIQKYIEADFEVRVYYLFGNVFALGMNRCHSSRSCVDIREIPLEKLEVKRTIVPSEIICSLQRLCESVDLSYCVFDFLVKDSEYALIDVTPNGSWAYLDVSGDITNWLIDVLMESKNV